MIFADKIIFYLNSDLSVARIVADIRFKSLFQVCFILGVRYRVGGKIIYNNVDVNTTDTLRKTDTDGKQNDKRPQSMPFVIVPKIFEFAFETLLLFFFGGATVCHLQSLSDVKNTPYKVIISYTAKNFNFFLQSCRFFVIFTKRGQ